MRWGAIVGIGFAALSVCAGAAFAEQIDHACAAIKPLRTDLQKPDWERTPTAENMSELYPARSEMPLDAKVAMRCAVRADGMLTDCTTLCEDPAGHGFGRATLGLARYFKLKPTVESGRKATGRTVIVRVRWKP